MTRLFNIFGEIKSVYIHKTPCSQLPEKENYKYFKQFDEIKGFKVAYIVFNKKWFLSPEISSKNFSLYLKIGLIRARARTHTHTITFNSYVSNKKKKGKSQVDLKYNFQ